MSKIRQETNSTTPPQTRRPSQKNKEIEYQKIIKSTKQFPLYVKVLNRKGGDTLLSKIRNTHRLTLADIITLHETDKLQLKENPDIRNVNPVINHLFDIYDNHKTLQGESVYVVDTNERRP